MPTLHARLIGLPAQLEEVVGHSVTLVETADGPCCVAFGGQSPPQASESRFRNDCYVWRSESGWTALHTTGNAPAGRARHAAASLGNGRLAVWGGASLCKELPSQNGMTARSGLNKPADSAVYILDVDGSHWYRADASLGEWAPSSRQGHAAAVVRDALVIVGGYETRLESEATQRFEGATLRMQLRRGRGTVGPAFSCTWDVLAPSPWMQLSCSVADPTHVIDHAIAYVGGELHVMGGSAQILKPEGGRSWRQVPLRCVLDFGWPSVSASLRSWWTFMTATRDETSAVRLLRGHADVLVAIFNAFVSLPAPRWMLATGDARRDHALLVVGDILLLVGGFRHQFELCEARTLPTRCSAQPQAGTASDPLQIRLHSEAQRTCAAGSAERPATACPLALFPSLPRRVTANLGARLDRCVLFNDDDGHHAVAGGGSVHVTAGSLRHSPADSERSQLESRLSASTPLLR